jgi:hypothetical protein
MEIWPKEKTRSANKGRYQMRQLRQRDHHVSGVIASLVLIVISLFLGSFVTSAGANVIQQSVLKLGPITYTPGTTSDLTRVLFTGNYNGAALVQASSSLTITRTVKGAQTTITVPVSASASSQPGGGKITPKPGFVSFGTSGSNTFMPGDTLAITLTFQGNVAVSTTGGLWLDVNPKNNDPSNVGSFKVKSQAAVFDPSYTISDNLDPTMFPDTLFTIENLAFLGDITTAELDALNLGAIAAGDVPFGATLASPSTFTLESSALTSSLFSQEFLDPFPEPGPGLWDVAVGQLFDPNSDTSYAFIDAYQGIPEPPAVMMFAAAIAFFAFTTSVSKQRRSGAGSGRKPVGGSCSSTSTLQREY